VIRLLLLVLVLVAGAAYVVHLVERRRREWLAHVRAAFLVGVPVPREPDPAFRDAALRSGAVRIRLPPHWAEAYPDPDHASFHDPGNPQRVLRVTSTVVEAGPTGPRALLQARGGHQAATVEDLPDGRLLLRSLEARREDGRDAVVYEWLCAAPRPSSRACLASFRFSVPEKLALDPVTRDLVAMLDHQVRSARVE
jgi:hypothetical protein